MKAGDCINTGRDLLYIVENPIKMEKTSRVGGIVMYAVKARRQNGEQVFLKYTFSNDKVTRDNMRREAKFCMYYPYIEKVYYTFLFQEKEREGIGVVVEYIEGKNLADYRNAQKVLDEDEMFRYMIQLLYGVQYYGKMRRDGMDSFIHRDLKPENIMVSEKEKRLYICDFDWSHIPGSNRTTRLGFVGGTYGYAPPDTREKSDMQVDIYSIGRIFCFWISRREYFRKKEQREYLDNKGLAYGLDPERIPEKFRQKKYEKFIRIIRRMVAPPRMRYKDISSIIREMQEFLIEYYGGKENYQDRFREEILLKAPMDKESKKVLRLGVANSIEKERRSYGLENHRVCDIKIKNQAVMEVYNLDGKAYYVPLNKELKKIGGTENYQIHNGDLFKLQDTTIDFMVI